MCVRIITRGFLPPLTGLLFLLLLVHSEAQVGRHHRWKTPPAETFAASWKSSRPGYSSWRSASPYVGSVLKSFNRRFSRNGVHRKSQERTPSWKFQTTRTPPWAATTSATYWRTNSPTSQQWTRAPTWESVTSPPSPPPPRRRTTEGPRWTFGPQYQHSPRDRHHSPSWQSSSEKTHGHVEAGSSFRHPQTTPSPYVEHTTPFPASSQVTDHNDRVSNQRESSRGSKSPYWRNRFRYQWSPGASKARRPKTTETPSWKSGKSRRRYRTRTTTPNFYPDEDYMQETTTTTPLWKGATSSSGQSDSPYHKFRTRLPNWWYRSTQPSTPSPEEKHPPPPAATASSRMSSTMAPEKSDSPYRIPGFKVPSWWITTTEAPRPQSHVWWRASTKNPLPNFDSWWITTTEAPRPKSHAWWKASTKNPLPSFDSWWLTTEAPSKRFTFEYPRDYLTRTPSREWLTKAPKTPPTPTAARLESVSWQPTRKPYTRKPPSHRRRYDRPRGRPTGRPRQPTTSAKPRWAATPERPSWESARRTTTPRPRSRVTLGDTSKDDYRKTTPVSKRKSATRRPPSGRHGAKSRLLKTKLGNPDWALPTSLPYWKKVIETPFRKRPTPPAWKTKITQPDWKKKSKGTHWSRWKTIPRPTVNYDALLEPTPPWNCDDDGRTDQERWRSMLYSLYGAWYRNGPLQPKSGRGG